MAKVFLMLLARGALGDDIELRLPMCSWARTRVRCRALADKSCVWSNNACSRVTDESTHIHPLDKNCDTYGYTESQEFCVNRIDVYGEVGGRRLDPVYKPPVQSFADCESHCNADGACYGYVVNKRGQCDLCGAGGFKAYDRPGPASFNSFHGEKNCKYCADFNVGYHGEPHSECSSFEECVLEGSVCSRICEEKPYDADGTCSNFCYHEHSRCASASAFQQNAGSVAECEKECSETANCNSFEYRVGSSSCRFCNTDDVGTVSYPDNYNWMAGTRTCVAATESSTTESPATTTVSAIAPTESMVEPAAASILAKSLVAKRLGASESEATDNQLEVAQQYSALVFTGGLIAGMTASFLVAAAVKRQSTVGAGGYSAA